ncbi:MAG: serine/threonine protein kinase [bacterium]|nr:serine/threonine protein kinase [bacterium]
MDDDDRTLDLPSRPPGSAADERVSGGVPPGADPVSEGRRIGPYLLRRRIGEGGMGLVWEADQQEPIRRRVALKMVKRGMDTAEFIARFSSERQALAMMNHPAIARVLDAGATEEGRPYFVMEYVEGVPLNVYCDQERLSLRRRLELFIHVCEGVQHAHQKAIIHRDLKPSNVLVTEVDGQPLPKIIDFGVAKALDRSQFDDTLSTGAGQLIGTPEYMSPEQTGLTGEGLDTRTDVYALGVLLYELLVGQRPFRREDLAALNFLEVLQVIREVEPPRPSTRTTTIARHTPAEAQELAHNRDCEPELMVRGLRGDLDWITMKALEKDRERRYDSASALAEDVRRHLADEPVNAGPPSRRYRVRKFVRRHRTGVLAGATALVAILLGIAGTTTGMIRAVNAERRARLEAETARQVSGFLVGLFEVADPDQARGNTITAREILDAGSDRIGRELSGQPQTQARLLGTMGTVYRKLGLYEEAEPKLLRALELRRAVPDVPAADLAAALGDLADLHLDQARYKEAEAAIAEALPLLDDSEREGRLHLASRLTDLGSVYRRQGRFDEADPLYRRALELRLAELGPRSTDVAASYNSLAILSWNRGRFDEAEQLYGQALAIWEAAYGQDHADVAKGLNNLALLYHHQKRYDKAEAMYTRAVGIYERILGADHPRLATAINNLALVVHEQGRLDEAEPLYRRALAIRESVLGPGHPDVAQTLNNIGNLQRDRRRWTEARADYDRALAIRTSALGSGHADVGWTLRDLGRLEREQGRPEAAEECFGRALEIFEASLGREHPDLAEFLDDYALAERDLGRTASADSLRRWADRVRPASP